MSQMSRNDEPLSQKIVEPSQPAPSGRQKERHFSVTVHDPIEPIESFWERLKDDSQYASLQLEICPKTNRPHF